ncbi:NAD(P)-dependent oxidoreductase [Acuticoccus sp. M5D2P5]|uniref:NAD(P)-dependent oxidoreductase n=1 Tax=Acuticoccus kalidii TaxID=2910977 RepID=UPI001F35289F|nr:NAD(P)-dependent oxidoreductase [Acuticoccus kalidii]MCF3933246.1 NAD(P)-dependent oxidoreductase [Acuticoccus kalidii]
MSSEYETVGFVGLGVMGRHMARNLVKAGVPLLVHDLNRAAVDDLVGAGARDAGSLEGIAAADIVVLMLPDTGDVDTVLFGENGLAPALRPGTALVDMSSISPVATRDFAARLAAAGVSMLDAPVSGGFQGAEQGTLSIMVGGDAATLERVRPVLSVMGKTINHIGEAGAGQVCKACNQVAVAISIQAVAESLTLARKNGVDPARVRDALLGGFAQSRALDLHGQRVLDGNYAAGFRVALQIKDLRIALETAGASNTPLPATALIRELYAMLAATGRADLDNSSLALLLHEMSGLDPAPAS